MKHTFLSTHTGVAQGKGMTYIIELNRNKHALTHVIVFGEWHDIEGDFAFAFSFKGSSQWWIINFKENYKHSASRN